MALSRLLRTLKLLYVWQDDEIDDLSEQLLDQRKAAWRETIEAEAAAHGCTSARAYDPAGRDLRELTALSDDDAQSISQTWARDVERQLTQLYTANPRGNRNYYIYHMERWASRRAGWKNIQIALMTESTARSYARERFLQENDPQSFYVYSSIPPVSDECIARTSAGVVDADYVRRHPVPAHVNCPHDWVLVRAQRLNCDEIWLGR
jgi:hypothetical protein